MQAGYVLGQQILNEFIASAAADASTNYWGIVNDIVGTYPNNAQGYLFRSLIVVEGGVANIALDAVYPTLTRQPHAVRWQPHLQAHVHAADLLQTCTLPSR